MIFKRSFLATAMVLLLSLLATASAQARNCFSLEGAPWESGDNVYIKVKNNCTTSEAFTWEVTTHNFGVHGRRTVGSPQTGTQAIKPGKTATVCAKKPTTSGKYCFRFNIKNKDMTKPNDTFFKWYNNIVVASFAGGGSSGNFEVGGSEWIRNDVILAAASDNPPGWELSLSRYHVSASEFPATVGWFVQTPAFAQPGEQVTLQIQGYDADSGDLVGTADITIEVHPGDEPVDATLNTGTSETVSVADEGGRGGRDDEVDPKPVNELPKPSFYAAREENGQAIVNKALLVAWDENSILDEDASVMFEVLGQDGWEVIGTEKNRAKDGPLGVALVYWDTTDLPAGPYQVRVTISNGFGSGTTERTLAVTKAPIAEPIAEIYQNTVNFDGSGSFDPDGSIAEWTWDFGDGTKVQGPVATHTYDKPGEYPVTLTVTDFDGNEDVAYCTYDSYEGFACDTGSCGCKKMDVKGEGKQSSMDMYWRPAGSKRTLGGINTIPNPPPAGGSGYSLRYSFEVEAELLGTNPAACESQQWINRTATHSGNTYDKTYNGQSFPYGSDNYAPDNYTGDSGVQTSTGGFIRWVDGPGVHGLSTGNITAGGVSYKAQFMAMVTGPLGTCKCTFEVVMEVDAAGKVVEKPKMKDKDCSP